MNLKKNGKNVCRKYIKNIQFKYKYIKDNRQNEKNWCCEIFPAVKREKLMLLTVLLKIAQGRAKLSLSITTGFWLQWQKHDKGKGGGGFTVTYFMDDPFPPPSASPCLLYYHIKNVALNTHRRIWVFQFRERFAFNFNNLFGEQCQPY